MEIVIRIAQLLLSLSILVVLHELGHFLAARYFGTRVEKFYLFFNPWFSLFKKKIGETEYGIGWLPLGGYVKISGMIDESMDTEQLEQEPQPYEFRSKPAWQRLIIMLGGIIVNLIVGFTIYTMILFISGDTVLPNKNLVDGVMVQNEYAQELGFRTGDKIVSIGDKEATNFNSLVSELIYVNTVKIDRDGKEIDIDIPVDAIGTLIDQSKRVPFFYPRFPFIVGAIPDSSHNANSGLMKNDTITSIGGQPIRYFDEAKDILEQYKNKDVMLGVVRKGENMEVSVNINDAGLIGIQPYFISLRDMKKMGLYQFEERHYSLLESFPAGWHKMVDKLTEYIRQFSLIFNPDTGAYKGLGGFGSISKMFDTGWNWPLFWESTAFLSLILAFMNLLPIPALDGGHVMFLLYEMVTGREPNQKFLEYAQTVGIILLLGLMLYANGNDLFRAIFK